MLVWMFRRTRRFLFDVGVCCLCNQHKRACSIACVILYFSFHFIQKIYSFEPVEKIISKVKDTFSVSVEIIQGNLKKLKKIISEKRIAESRNNSQPEKFSIFSHTIDRSCHFFLAKDWPLPLSYRALAPTKKKGKIRKIKFCVSRESFVQGKSFSDFLSLSVTVKWRKVSVQKKNCEIKNDDLKEKLFQW